MIPMAASNRHHRKLIQSPTNATSQYVFCSIQCDPITNPTGVCSLDCTVFCRSFCRPTDTSPTPSPATSPYTVPPPTDHQNQPLSLPLKISLIFLIATVVYTVYKFYTVWHRSRPRRRTPPPPPENEEIRDDNYVVDHPIWYIRTTGLPPSVINALTVVKFSKVNSGVVEGTDCSVCLTEFEDDDTLRLLPKCNHAFHMSCIDTWLRSHTNCPLCRALIVSNTVDSSSEGQSSNLGFIGGINLGVLSGDRGEASGSSGLRIGGTQDEDEDDDVNNSNFVKTEG